MHLIQILFLIVILDVLDVGKELFAINVTQIISYQEENAYEYQIITLEHQMALVTMLK